MSFRGIFDGPLPPVTEENLQESIFTIHYIHPDTEQMGQVCGLPVFYEETEDHINRLAKAHPNPKMKAMVEELLLAALNDCMTEANTQLAHIIIHKKTIIDWKNKTGLIDKILSVLMDVGKQDNPSPEEIDSWEPRFYSLENIAKIVEELFTQIKLARLSDKYNDKIYEMYMIVLNHGQGDSPLRAAVDLLLERTWYQWKDIRLMKAALDQVFEVVQKYPAMSRNEDSPDYHSHFCLLGNIYQQIIESTIKLQIPEQIIYEVTKIFETLKDTELFDHEVVQDMNINGVMVMLCISYLQDIVDRWPHLVKPMIGMVKQMWKSGDENFEKESYKIITSIGEVDILGDENLEEIIDKYLSTKDTVLLESLIGLYSQAPEKIYSRMDEFVSVCKGTGSNAQIVGTVNLFWTISQLHPQEITKKTIQFVADNLQVRNCDKPGLATMACLAQTRPDDIIAHDDIILSMMSRNPTAGASGAEVLVHLAVEKKYATKYLRRLAKMVPSSQHQEEMLEAMKDMGQKYRDSLMEHKGFFEKMRKKKKVPTATLR